MRPLIIRALDLLGGSFDLISAEGLLNYYPNGGTIIALRTLWMTFLVLVVVLVAHQIFPNQPLLKIADLLKVIGAASAVIYAALYARFASQWGYLAKLYNDIMEAKIDNKLMNAYSVYNNVSAAWIAGFIEDAEDLHLATKAMFLPAIYEWLRNEEIKRAFIEGVLGGDHRYYALMARVTEAIQFRRKH